MPGRRILKPDGSDPYGTTPMDLVIPVSESGKEKSKKRYVKPETYGKCPRCTAPRVALMKTGGHIVWKEHTKATYGRARFLCDASGVAFCQTGEGAPSLHPAGIACYCQRKA